MRVEKIHEDNRGEIFKFDIGEQEYLIIVTNKGCKRGGEVHDRNQYIVVLRGEIEVMLYDVDSKTESMSHRYNPVGEGELVKIPTGIPHYMTSLTDSVFLEWKGEKWNSKSAVKMAKLYRKIVEKTKK